jgi:GlpG protein
MDMRMIGHLTGEANARVFGDYLYVQGIENQIEVDKGDSWSVWILVEEELPRARELLQQFGENPGDPKFQSTARAADALREKKKQEQTAYEKRVKERGQLFRSLSGYGLGPVTFVLIAMSVVVYLTSLSKGAGSMNILHISDYDIGNADTVGLWQGLMERIRLIHQDLPEIRSGEVWRLFTPMFIHYGLMHIFFNMLWLRDLGSMIEGRQSSLTLVLLVVGIAMVSNVAQYFVGGNSFGGMSGVVYGLFGYIWIRGKLDPASGMSLHSSTVTMMIIWFFVCFSGLLGDVANTCHAAGLLMGMAWGGLAGLRHS